MWDGGVGEAVKGVVSLLSGSISKRVEAEEDASVNNGIEVKTVFFCFFLKNLKYFISAKLFLFASVPNSSIFA